MIYALALRLEGPMQSWGGPVAGDDRPSLDVPTKSGVLGLIAGAFGVERSKVEPLGALHAAFALAVRVDRGGIVGIDYHTAEWVPTFDGGIKSRSQREIKLSRAIGRPREELEPDMAPVLSRRRYLYDAAFTALVVAREGAPPLEEIAHALRHPRFPPFLGRRACVPSGRVLEGEPIAGENWRALFDQIPLAERAGKPPYDVHLDAELAEDISYRPRRQRDVLIGRLPRLFGERVIHVAPWTPPSGANVKETIDPWMP